MLESTGQICLWLAISNIIAWNYLFKCVKYIIVIFFPYRHMYIF